jgi:hypothetical protein
MPEVSADGSDPMPAAALLDDDALRTFLIQGYHLVHTDFPAEFHEEACRKIAEVFVRRGNPGNEILEEVPALNQVYAHPAVRGALTSVLGPGYVMHAHRHCHASPTGTPGQQWHQDDVNSRHHQIWRVLAMYYPQAVTAEMGPTMILPGTQFRNAPTARMATYRTFGSEVALKVPAGTVAITHYDIWHRAAPNRSDRTRYMLKFLFDRTRQPDAPSWACDPDRRDEVLTSFNRVSLPIDNQSDAYKHRVIWMNCWNWLMGGDRTGESSIIDHYP